VGTHAQMMIGCQWYGRCLNMIRGIEFSICSILHCRVGSIESHVHSGVGLLMASSFTSYGRCLREPEP
jgi:hypothetical protein